MRAELRPLSLSIVGVPVPKGSKSLFRGRMVESSKAWPAWLQLLRDESAIAMRQDRHPLFQGPVSVTLTFVLPKPQRPRSPFHVTKPDLDKLIRGVLDGLTKIVWYDDAQVFEIVAVKRYPHSPTDRTRVDIDVDPFE